MRDFAELNVNEGGRPVNRPPPTDEIVQAFERVFDVTLPPGYVSLLRHSNGGHPALDTFTTGGGVTWAVNRFYHLTSDTSDVDGLFFATTEWRAHTGLQIVAFAEDGVGNQIVLDFAMSPPCVELCLHDKWPRMVHVANSIEEFIDSLMLDPDAI